MDNEMHRSQRHTKNYEASRSVKLNKYLKYDAYLLDRARDIWQNHWTMHYRSRPH